MFYNYKSRILDSNTDFIHNNIVFIHKLLIDQANFMGYYFLSNQTHPHRTFERNTVIWIIKQKIGKQNYFNWREYGSY